METRTGTVTLPHDGTALAKFVRVKWDGSALAACSATEKGIGTLADTVLSGATKAAVILNSGGARKFVAGGAFAVGAKIYGAASGKVDDVTGGGQVEIGQAIEAATGDNSIVEVAMIAGLAVPA